MWRANCFRWPRLEHLCSRVVEPAWKFDVPEYRRRAPTKPDAVAKVAFHIHKHMAGSALERPTPEELLSWFELGAPEPTADRRLIVRDVIDGVVQFQGRGALDFMADEVGLRVVDLGRFLGQCGLSTPRSCLWINEFAWRANPTPMQVLIRREREAHRKVGSGDKRRVNPVGRGPSEPIPSRPSPSN